MSVIENGTNYSLRVVYKTAYDTNGDFPQLGNFSQTFGDLLPTAPLESLKGFADSVMALTEYKNAPYRVLFDKSSELVVG